MRDQEDLIFYKVSLQNYFGIKLLIDKSMFFVSACLFMMQFLQFFKVDFLWTFSIRVGNLVAAMSFVVVIFFSMIKWNIEGQSFQQLFPKNFKSEIVKGDYSKVLPIVDSIKHTFFITGLLSSLLSMALVLNS